MKFIKNMIRNLIKWATNEEEKPLAQEEKYAMSANNGAAVSWPFHGNNATIGSSAPRIDSSAGMNFTVYNAVGGKVVQFSTYNIHTDRNNVNLYIITDREDLGQELGHILTRESLTK
jgi:hypothetical protein